MQLFYRIAADLTVVLHFAYVLFVIIGLVVTLAGAVFRWHWVRNFKFRAFHLASILFVVAEAWLGIVCPLTIWEKQLRAKAGQTSYQGDFIANLVHDVLFFDAPNWVFTLCYSLFGLAVLATFVLAPPRFHKEKHNMPPPV